MSCEFSFARTGRTRSEGPSDLAGTTLCGSRAEPRCEGGRNVSAAARGSSFLCVDGGCDNGHIKPPCSIIIISSSSSRRREQWQNRRHHTATVSAAVIQFLVHQSVHAGPPRNIRRQSSQSFRALRRQSSTSMDGINGKLITCRAGGRSSCYRRHRPVCSTSYELRVQEELRPLPLPPHHLLSGLEGERVERTDGSETLQVETAMMMGRRPETETSPAKDWGR